MHNAELGNRPVTPQTPFQIGSTDKSLATLTIMRLVEAGKITFLESCQVYSSIIPFYEPIYMRVIPAEGYSPDFMANLE